MSNNTDTDGSNIRFEPELGEHNIQDELTSDSITNTYTFEVEAETVFKRLAEDIYNGKEAGIREPLTNGITAVYRAIEDGYMDNPSEGIILFELYDTDDIQRLKIRDNGVGMTRDEIDKVVSVIGTSTSRSSANLTGKFGMGFLATWMIAGGVEGGFTMHTNPRGVDEGPISGIWTSNCFSELEENKLEGSLDDDDYGTVFDIMIDQNLEVEQVIDWIYKYSEWSRIPILFRHYTEEGLTDEEFTPKKILDMYESIENEESTLKDYDKVVRDKDGMKYYTIENEHFTAVNSNIKKDYYANLSNVILLDVPVDNAGQLSNYKNYPLPSIEIRIDSEIPVVVDGPHKGKYVVSDLESKQLGDEYISINNITNKDIMTPAPTGTRDMLQDSEKFTEWLADKFYNIHYDNIAGLLREVDSTSDYLDLSEEERYEFHNLITYISDITYQLQKSDISNVENTISTTFTSDFKNKLPILHTECISVAPEDKKGVSKMENRDSEKIKDIFAQSENENFDVYMSHRITQENAEFVWESDTDAIVVRVDSSNQDTYQDEFGWKLLSDLDYETSLEMSDEKRAEFTTKNTNVADEIIKLHIGSYSVIKDIKASDLKEIVREKETILCSNDEYQIQKLILFKRGDTSVSKHKDMVNKVVATTSVSSNIYDYLINTPNVWDANTAIDKEIIIPASDGNMYNINEDITENMVTHIVNDETIEDFRDEEFMNNVEEYLNNLDSVADDVIYLPMTEFEYYFRFDFSSTARKTYGTYRAIKTQRVKDMSAYSLKTNDVSLYVNTMVDEETPTTKALKTVSTIWNEGGKEIVNMYKNSSS